MEKLKTSLLIGAGLSVVVGKPSTKDITNEILSMDSFEMKTRGGISYIQHEEERSFLTSFNETAHLFLNNLFRIAEDNNVQPF